MMQNNFMGFYFAEIKNRPQQKPEAIE